MVLIPKTPNTYPCQPPRGVYISALDLAIQEGDTPTYVVALTSQPTGDVTIEIEALNDRDSDGRNNVNTVPGSLWSETRELAFTTENWHVAQTVTVNSDEDPDRDDHTATIRHQVSGADYGENDVTAPSIRVSVEDVAWVYYYIEAPCFLQLLLHIFHFSLHRVEDRVLLFVTHSLGKVFNPVHTFD